MVNHPNRSRALRVPGIHFDGHGFQSGRGALVVKILRDGRIAHDVDGHWMILADDPRGEGRPAWSGDDLGPGWFEPDDDPRLIS